MERGRALEESAHLARLIKGLVGEVAAGCRGSYNLAAYRPTARSRASNRG
jgi:hypothetical protein